MQRPRIDQESSPSDNGVFGPDRFGPVEAYDDDSLAMRRLEKPAPGTNNEVKIIVFPGHLKENYRLLDTWKRHHSLPLERGKMTSIECLNLIR